MSLVHANGIDIYYEQQGEGVPILCIHGTSSSALVWEDALIDLAEHGRCISYDRRGSFRSQRPEPYETTHVTEHTDDAAALLDALSAIPAVVIGRSYGGEIAIDLACRYPDKVIALALLEPAMLQLHREGMTWLQPLIDKVLAAGKETYRLWPRSSFERCWGLRPGPPSLRSSRTCSEATAPPSWPNCAAGRSI